MGGGGCLELKYSSAETSQADAIPESCLIMVNLVFKVCLHGLPCITATAIFCPALYEDLQMTLVDIG